MTAPAKTIEPAGTLPWAARAGGWLRGSRAGLFVIAVLVGAGSGLGAVAFRYLIYFFTWLATGHVQFGQDGYVGSSHLPWLGLGFFVVIPVIGGLVYGPLIYRYAREARGHGVPEVMIAVAENGGRIRPAGQRRQGAWPRRCASGSAGRSAGRARSCRSARRWPPGWASGCGCRRTGCGSWSPAALRGGIAATFNAPITGVFFGVEIILREFSVDALFTVMLSAMLADAVAIPFLGNRPFLNGFPAGHRAAPSPQLPAGRGARGGRGPDRAGVQDRRVQDGRPVGPGLEEPAGVGPPGGRRHRARAGAAGAAADVRGRLPGHVQGHRRELRAVVPARAGGREDPRLQPDPGHRRVGRGVRAVAVHRRHLRHGLRRDR